MRTPRALTAMACLSLLVAVCGAGCSGKGLAQTYGACGQPVENGVGGAGAVASVERWLEVRSVTRGMRDHESTAGGSTIAIPMSVAPVSEGASEPGSASVEQIAVHTSFLPGIDWGIDHGAPVYLGLAHTGLEREMVAFALVRPQKDPSFFAGECQYDMITRPLQDELGTTYERSLDSIIGVTDRGRIMKALGEPADA